MPRRRPGETFRCECGEACIGALTLAGKVAPIELNAKPEGTVWLGKNKDGVVASMVLGGPLLEAAREGGMGLHLNHFASCPHAARFRS